MSSEHEMRIVEKNIRISLLLNTGFTIFEFIIGIFAGSLALVSDAAHNLTDSLSLLITYSANKIAKRKSNIEHSYGYGRATILAALINATILIILSMYIFYEAYQRFQNPEPVKGQLVAIVAFIGVLINGSIAMLFYKNKSDLNIRSAYLNMLFDTLASVGALIAGVVIVFTNQTIIDPLISVLIGVMLLFSAKGVITDALHILLEGVPEGINPQKVRESIQNTTKVKAVDDLHIWAISSHYAALSCHIVIEDCDLNESTMIMKEIKQVLKERFNIEHATLEPELTECPPDN